MKYKISRNYFDFIRRKIFLFAKRISLFGTNVFLAQSSDVSPSSRLLAGSGKIVIGESSLIDRGCMIRAYGGEVELGKNCTLGPYSVLYGGGSIKIGNGVRIGPQCAIIAANHFFNDREAPIYSQGMICKGIRIDDDVWIGAGAKILDGVSIGRGAVVAAGAVVTKSVLEWQVVGGVPARVMSVRGEKRQSIMSKQESEC